jgi:excisionase family DNA binding protein
MSATDLTTTEVLTIEEAATLLRISRNAAYAAARQWRATGGETGIPCIEIGRTLRVPRADLDKLLGRTAGPGAA